MSFANFFDDVKKRRNDLNFPITSEPDKSNIIAPKTSIKKKRKTTSSKPRKNNKNHSTTNIKLEKHSPATTDSNTLSANEFELLNLIQIHETKLNEKSKLKNNVHRDRNKAQKLQQKAVSQDALDLSTNLKELSNQKRLSQALKLYYDPRNDSIRDGHHGSIMIDCCSRCGNVEEGEQIFKRMLLQNEMKEDNVSGNGMRKQLSVQAYTSLMKGYVHSGHMHKAVKLYHIMWTFKDRYARPNVRTLNTFLRGCLWTAASAFYNNNECEGVGGVLSSEDAWEKSKQYCKEDLFDFSSYEYSITLLCQSLRVQDAQKRIQNMMENTSLNSEQDKKETLASSYVSLARAYALLGMETYAKENAQKAVSIFKNDCHGIIQAPKNDPKQNSKMKNGGAVGGKRAWRHQDMNDSNSTIHQDQIQNRSLSNQLFRGHRKSELMREAQYIIDLQFFPTRSQLAFLQITRLLYFGGGGTTNLKATKRAEAKVEKKEDPGAESLCKELLQTLWYSFGLAALVKNASSNSSNSKSKIMTDTVSGVKPNFMISKNNIKDIERFIGWGDKSHLVRSTFTKEGFIDFSHIFSPFPKQEKWTGDSKAKPIYMELGAGSGDWIISQAIINPNANYISVELRADRVAQTFAKAVLRNHSNKRKNDRHMNKSKGINVKNRTNSNQMPIMNLCCCGSECNVFLRKRIPPHSISRIYVNHPEPPTQTGPFIPTDGKMNGSKEEEMEEESAHMLNSSTLNAALDCLKGSGKGEFIVVTDNRWYATLICKTIVKVIHERNQKHLLFGSHSEKGNHEDSGENINFEQKIFSHQSSKDLHAIEMFPLETIPNSSSSHNGNSKSVILYEGQPCPAVGHVLEHALNASVSDNDMGISYFDRLWRTGAGRHAEVQTRFIIALQTCSEKMEAKTNTITNSGSDKGPSNKNKWKAKSSTEKRNEMKTVRKKVNKAKYKRRNKHQRSDNKN